MLLSQDFVTKKLTSRDKFICLKDIYSLVNVVAILADCWPKSLRSLKPRYQQMATWEPRTASRAVAKSVLSPSTRVMRFEKACSSGASLDFVAAQTSDRSLGCAQECLGDEGGQFAGDAGDGDG